MFVFRSLILVTRTEGKETSEKTNDKRRKVKETCQVLFLNRRYCFQSKVEPLTNQYYLLPIMEVEINSSDVASNDSHHVWVLIHMAQASNSRERVYQFANRCQAGVDLCTWNNMQASRSKVPVHEGNTQGGYIGGVSSTTPVVE